jgi:hypothetical protein
VGCCTILLKPHILCSMFIERIILTIGDLSSSAQLHGVSYLVKMGWCGLDWSGSGYGQVESSCEFGIEASGSMKCWETIECRNN